MLRPLAAGVLLASGLLPLPGAADTGALLAQPLEGAFGFNFGVPLPAEAVAAALNDRSRQPALPENLQAPDEALIDRRGNGWHYLEAETLPEKLNSPETVLMGLLTEQALPARLVLSFPERGCKGLYHWLKESLQRKYAVEEDPGVPARAPHLEASRFRFEARQIDLACGPDVRLQYTDEAALALWVQELSLARQRQQERTLAAETLAAQIAASEGRRFADRFTLGDASRLQGALSVTFGQPLASAPRDFASDTPFAFEPDNPPEPFAAGDFEIELDPEARPIELTGTLPDPAGKHFEAIDRALKAKFGKPIKDTDRHKIFRINGNFFVLRALPATGKLRVNVLDGNAKRAQRDRAKAAEAAELAALEAEFHKETDGL